MGMSNPAERRPLATRFGVDARVAILTHRSWALWLLGYPEAALADRDHALKDAREIGHAATLMVALTLTSLTRIWCGDYAAASAQLDEVVSLADEKDAFYWKACAMSWQDVLLALTGNVSNATQMITSGIAAWRSAGATNFVPSLLSCLTTAYAELGHFDDAWRCIGEAMTAVDATKERMWEADLHRMAGEIALKSPERDAAKAEAYFERALSVARASRRQRPGNRARSIARLWRRAGQATAGPRSSRPGLRLVHRGLRHVDLKEAKPLLNQLACISLLHGVYTVVYIFKGFEWQPLGFFVPATVRPSDCPKSFG